MHEIGINKSSVDHSHLSVSQNERFQHTYVVGQTGTGKSTFLKNSFLQDVHAGFGACYFDFHGEDASWLLDRIPSDRIKDVIYIDPNDASHSIGYNVLDGVSEADYPIFTDEIVSSLRHIHSASWGARMDDILTNAIRPLLDLPSENYGSMPGVVRMLNDTYYRNWVVKQCKEPTVHDFWLTEYAGWSKTDKAHNLNSSLNKIRRFQSAPTLRDILIQRSKVNFGRIISDGQIAILNINKWRMGSTNASTLAALILSRLIYEVTRRPGGEGIPVNPFHIYIDEFQSITTQSTAEALSGIRKYRAGFTLAHQFTHQLDPDVFKAIMGNVGTKVIFRVGGADAEQLHRGMDVTNPRDLAELSDFEFIAHYKYGRNVRTNRGSAERLQWEYHGHGEAIRALMRAKYARPRDEVEAQYQRWKQSRHFGGVTAPATVKRKATPEKKTSKIQQGMRSVSHILSGG